MHLLKNLVICNRYVVPANDNGDFYTVNSYDKERYSKEIPSLKDGTRLTDILDLDQELLISALSYLAHLLLILQVVHLDQVV